MKIINHPSIINAKTVQVISGCFPHRRVLRHIPENKITPYVIHTENLQIEGDAMVHMDFYQGQYFKDLGSASRIFDSIP